MPQRGVQVQEGTTGHRVTAAERTDYGLDAPFVVRRMLTHGSLLLAAGVVIFFANRESSPAAASSLLWAFGSAGVSLLAAAAIMVWSSRVGKLRARDRILEALPWRSDEKVLDVGCGRGLFLIGAAKRLTSGRAVGVDLWNAQDLSGNHPDATRRNAKIEGVLDRIKIEDGDARKLSAAAGAFDIVLSSLALHNISSKGERQQALGEMARVLKPGGLIAIFDIFHTADYAKELGSLGFTDVRLSGLSLLWCLPTRYVIARKLG